MSALQAIQPEVLLFNLYSAFGFHLAEVMDIDCACVSPGAPPSVHAAHRVLPKQVLERLEEEDSDDFCADKLTVGDLEHWMLPLFLPHYQRWRLKWGLSPLLVMPGKEYPVRPSVPILYGVSPALLPRPGCWPAKAQVCGFWAFNHVSPHYSPPERLVRFLKSRGECPKRPLFCVGLGSMPDLGLIEDPSSLLNLVAVALKRVGADGVFLAKQADLSTASPRQPRGTTPPATLATPPSLGDCVHPRSKRSRTEGEGGVSVEGARENEGEGEVVGEHKGSLEDTKEVLQEGLDCPLRKMAGNMNPSEPSLDLEGGGCRERNQAGNDLMGMKDECMKEMSTVLVLGEGEFVPHAWLLPWCYGMVHHGGSGTTGAGLRYGERMKQELHKYSRVATKHKGMMCSSDIRDICMDLHAQICSCQFELCPAAKL
ncbi:unnamed protein product [Discosporangium mesarthrocarpum]